MPWYWTDEVVPFLVSQGSLDAEVAANLTALPFALRSEHQSLEEAAKEMLDDGEIPLAA